MDGLSVRLHDNPQPSLPVGYVTPQSQAAVRLSLMPDWLLQNVPHIFRVDIATILLHRNAEFEI
jgi:hypothetical protein